MCHCVCSQVAEALHFLHKEARLLHGNLTPQSVAVTREGGWKLLGFNFSCFSQYQSDAQVRRGGCEAVMGEGGGGGGELCVGNW